MPNLRSKLIRLAHTDPELRPHLLSLLAKQAGKGPDPKGRNWKKKERGGIKAWMWTDPKPKGDWAPATFTVVETDDASNDLNDGYSYILVVKESSGFTWQYKNLLKFSNVAFSMAENIFKTWVYPQGMADNFRRNFNRRSDFRLGG